MRFPDFFIVGAPKCGTTALANFLNQTANVSMLPKEIHHFGSDLKFQRPIETRKQYLSRCEIVPNDHLIGDASVYYLSSELAAKEIKAAQPKAKIVICLRHPVDFMLSLHAQLRSNVDEPLARFEDALNAEPERTLGRNIPWYTHATHGLLYRRVAQFDRQVQRYFDVFGREKVKVVIMEEMKSSMVDTYREVCRFVGAEPDETVDFKIVNPTTEARNLWFRIAYKKCFSPAGKVRQVTPAAIELGVDKFTRWFTTRPGTKVKMTQGLRESLDQEFQPVINNLNELLGREISAWQRKKVAA